MPDSQSWLPQMLVPAVAKGMRVSAGPAYVLHPAAAGQSRRALRIIAEGDLSIQAPTDENGIGENGIGVVEKTLFDDFTTYDDDVKSVKIAPPAGPTPFFPREAIWHYGPDKPGATMVQRLRRVNQTIDMQTSQARPVEATIRAPQILAPSRDAFLKIDSAVMKATGSGLARLEIKWTEGAGLAAIGPVDTTAMIKDVDLGLHGENGLPPLALFQRLGDRLLPIPLESGRLTIPKSTATPVALYIVSQWTLLEEAPTGYEKPVLVVGVDEGKPLKDVVVNPPSASAPPYTILEIDRKMFGDAATTWNLTWPNATTPESPGKLFLKEGTLDRPAADVPEPPRVAAVLRFGTRPNVWEAAPAVSERTLFSGAAATTQGVVPAIEFRGADAFLVLRSKGYETVELSALLAEAVTTADDGRIALVKYHRDGSTLAAIEKVTSSP